ncbi:MAG TPA: PP2C family protein-serine/threonine phosphatase [Terriglobia bacterium]|jgi:sigma-B regulation protein RsbU (phosphoserine phosphatase)|nr:PP2C family protein-serine/threonine phosphatase [Terriglobia bacterium]
MNQAEISSRLACFALWSGNHSADHPVELPGLAGWIYSEPLEPDAGGGDVHYLSVCSKGMVSRVAVADVAGHGNGASSMAETLRHVLQRHTDNWDQSALMQELNDAMVRESTKSQYATAAVLGFYFETGELIFSSAGHPPPLWYRASDKSWNWLEECTPFAVDIEGLPLGLIPGTTYSQTAVRLGADDMLVLYTDGITETADSAGNELGYKGLADLARGLATDSTFQVSRDLMAGVRAFRGDAARRDDETLVVLQRVTEQEA